MQIGIDYLPATSHASGVGRYARELVRALVSLEQGPELRLFDVGRAERSIDPRSLGISYTDARVKRVTRDMSRRVLAWRALAGFDAAHILGGVDLFHQVLHAIVPVKRARQTIALSTLPERGSDADRKLSAALARMDGVFVFATHWKGIVAERYRVSPERVFVTPVGCEHWRRDLAEIPAISDPPIVLVLGATRPERRHVAILRAFERLRTSGVAARLLIVGRAGESEDDLKRALIVSQHASDVERRTAVAESEMPALVARASVLVHLDPGAMTPVTPLEALAVGVPVVASRSPVFLEALGSAAVLVDDVEAVRVPEMLADELRRAIESRRDENALDRRVGHARDFTWPASAAAHIGAWKSVISRGI